MATKGKGAQTNQEHPKVTFSIEVRPCTPIQIEAGKKLFSKLLQRAMEEETEKQDARAQGGGGQ